MVNFKGFILFSGNQDKAAELCYHQDMEFEQNYFAVPPSLNWDEYFMLQAMMASFKSKDPSTKVGCVVVDRDHRQVTMGYNGFIAGIDESKLPWGKDKSVPLEHQKYGYVVHAETNAILHAPRSLEGCRAYVTVFPCHECAKLIASKRISEIVYLSDKRRDLDSTRIAEKIFELSGIGYRRLQIDKSLIDRLNQHLLDLQS